MDLNADEEIIKSFNRIEKKLWSAIKKLPAEIQDSDDTEVLKKRIKSYIEQVAEIKAMLDEYESIADLVKKIPDKKEGKDVAKAIVDLRPDGEGLRIKTSTDNHKSKTDDKESRKKKEEYEDVVIDGKVVGKKLTKKPTREF